MKIQTRYTFTSLFLYFILTLLMTLPVINYFASRIPGDFFDGLQNYWNLWWTKQALLVEATNPFFTHYVDAPSGVSLLFHTLNIFNGLWTLPLQLNFGLAFAYNSVVLLSFTLAGFGAYLLALYTLTKTFPGKPGLRGAAFVGGLIFTMSPFHMAHLLGHMQVFSMIWPPFYILWLIRTLDPWSPPGSPPPQRQLQNAALTCLFLILTTMVDWYHTLYLLMFTGILLLWILWRNRRQITRRDTPISTNSFFRPIIMVAAIGVAFGIILSPLLVPMVTDASARPDLDTGLTQNIDLSADLLAFVLPSEMHPIWGDWTKEIANNFTTSTAERLVFAGFVPLMLGLLILVRAWSKISVKFWSLILVFFLLMSLGPFLHINGQIVTIGSWPVPLPYLALFYTVPFINLTRSLSRYDLMVMLSLGILAALGLIQLQLELQKYRWRNLRLQVILPVIASILICFEFLAIPYPVSTLDTPQFYSDLKNEEGDFIIAELPMDWPRPTTLLNQTIHGKRLLTGYTSRGNPLLLAGKMPIFQQWQNHNPDILDLPLAEIAPTLFFDFNLRYIVLDYWQMPAGPKRDVVEQWLFAALPNAQPVYDDGRIKAYKSPPKGDTTQPYLSLGDGWSELQPQPDGSVFRVGQQPELFLHHPQNLPFSLEITAAADENTTPTITVSADGDPIGTLRLGSDFSSHVVELPPNDALLVKIQFATDNPDDEIVVTRIGLTHGTE